MKRRVVFRPPAKTDLRDIYDYIARDSRANAARFVDEIERYCLRLADFLERGVRRGDLRRGIRTISIRRRILIAYVLNEDRVEIARILYGGRDLSRALQELPNGEEA